MNNETHKPTLDLSEIRKEVGGALWLLVTYADMAAKGWSAHDDDLAHVLGTSTFAILRWKIKLIKTGLINGADRSHRATGHAEIVRRDDGSLVLHLRDFRVTKGPALRVLLTKHPNPTHSRDVEREEYIDLGALRSNRGDQ